MHTRRFGRSGLRVAPLAIGTMTMGDRLDEAASHVVLDWAYDFGLTFFDTANTYVAGRTEEIVGAWFAARGRRDRIVLSSKVRMRVGDDMAASGLDARTVIREVEASLRRLSTDHLDILFLHQPDDETPIAETLRVVDTLFAQGKIRCLGLSNFAAWQVVDAIRTAEAMRSIVPVVLQPMYNAVARMLDEELLPMARAFDLGICAYNPLAGGLLTAKHVGTPTAAEGARLASNPMYRARYWHDALREGTGQLSDLAQRNGRTLSELALRFVLDTPGIQVALMGGTSLAQFQENARALDAPALTDAERAGCDAIWATLRGAAPKYMRTNAEMPRG